MGANGSVGPAGPTGPMGTAGTAGTNGTNGQNGNDGAAGPAGPAGPTGSAGTDGRSAQVTGPGIQFDVESAAIDAQGVATAVFTVKDADDKPLDVDGVFTEGAISVRFVLAWLGVDDQGRPNTYTAYTTRQATGNGQTVTQASTDSNGMMELMSAADGRYRYTFGTMAMPADRTLTHIVAAYATRTVDGVRYVSNDELTFRPDGMAVTVTREVVTDAACNNCHGDLAIHGGSRKHVQLCITCHQPQSSDPDTGNTVDMTVMIHKIHMGEHLPSVQNGTPYRIIGNRNSVHDYSTVLYPQPLNDCSTCHQGANGMLGLQRPTRAACGSCHDGTSFVDPAPMGMTLHSGGAAANDMMCATCHPASGGLAGITDKHAVGLLDPMRPRVEFGLVSITDTAPGQTPTVRFTVSVGGTPRDIVATPLTTLRATFFGPNTDVARFWQGTIQGGGASGTLAPVAGMAGTFDWTAAAAAAIPADASGSYTVGLEGYIQETGGPRNAAEAPILAFAVTDATARARRTVVSSAKCNSCHKDLALHGDQRKNPNYCVACHNPDNVNEERFARREGRSVWIPSVDLGVMAHKIHAGEHLTQQPYILGGFPVANAGNPDGNPINFGEVRYPNTLSNCKVCHEGTSYSLPLAAGVQPIRLEQRTCTEDPAADADDYCAGAAWEVSATRMVPRQTAVCTACHDDDATAAHAELETTTGGVEACATCHGSGSAYDVELVHGLE